MAIKTIRGLAKLLGFAVDADQGGDGAATAFDDVPTAGSGGGGNGNRSNFGVPEGFVVQQPSSGGGGNTASPPPQRTNAQDFFNQMSNFDPGIPTSRIQPPPAGRNGGNNSLAGPGDEVLSQENVPDFFNSADGGRSGGGRAPQADFDFGGGGTPATTSTMSFEQAAQRGLIGGSNAGNGYADDQVDEFDTDVPLVPPTDDNAASGFRNNRRPGGGVRNTDAPKPPRGVRGPRINLGGRRNQRPNVNAGTGPTIRDRVLKIITPVEVRTNTGGITMAVPTLSPEARKARDAQRRRTTLYVLIGVVLLLLFIAVLVIPIIFKSGTGTTTPPQVALTLPLKTTDISSSVRLTLDPNAAAGTTSVPTAAPTVAGPTAADGSGAATGTDTSGASTGLAGTATVSNTSPINNGILPVKNVNTGDIKKTGEAVATGTRQVPDKAAAGPVSFFNTGAAAVSYGAGAVIYTANGINYRLVQGVTVGAGNPFSGARGQASGQLAADKQGTVGNTDKALSRLMTNSLGVTIGPFTGGSDRTEKFVTQADLDNLTKQLQDQARSDANSAVQTTPGQAVTVVKSTAPTCEFNKNVNDATDDSGKFQGNCTMQLQAIVYQKDQLAAAVQSQLVKDPNFKLDSNTPVQLIGQPTYDTSTGKPTLVVQASGKEISNIDVAALKDKIAGQTKVMASQIITGSFPQVDPNLLQPYMDQILTDPLPTADHLDITLVPDYQAATAGLNTTPGTATTPGATGGPQLVTNTPNAGDGTTAPATTPPSS